MKLQKILSKDNEKIRFVRKLRMKKIRRKFAKFMVENFTIIYDAAMAGFTPQILLATPDFIKKNKDKLEQVLAKNRLLEYYIIDEKINQSFSELDSPAGICAVYDQPQPKIDWQKPIVYLNAINDPGNLGTIIRSALAFDLKNIVVDEQCADVFNNKSVNAAKDAIFKVNITRESISKIKEKMTIVCTSQNTAKKLADWLPSNKFCLVLGSEAHGIDPQIQELADESIAIPMSQNMESLNVASAAAIIFYHFYHQ